VCLIYEPFSLERRGKQQTARAGGLPPSIWARKIKKCPGNLATFHIPASLPWFKSRSSPPRDTLSLPKPSGVFFSFTPIRYPGHGWLILLQNEPIRQSEFFKVLLLTDANRLFCAGENPFASIFTPLPPPRRKRGIRETLASSH
jgi:hypothetical protein